MPRLYVGGPSGCGKTAMVKQVKNLLGISYLSGSEIMMRAAGVQTREALALLPEEQIVRLRETAFLDYYKANENLITEGHYFLTQPDTAYLDAYILVEIPAKLLITLRQDDHGRIRSTDPSEIQTETALLNQRVSECQTRFGINVIRVSNNSTFESFVAQIVGIYENLSGAG